MTPTQAFSEYVRLRDIQVVQHGIACAQQRDTQIKRTATANAAAAKVAAESLKPLIIAAL
jgi:hypothetical protein